jgi:phosphoribosyl-ATP pyrophosphohydrolase
MTLPISNEFLNRLREVHKKHTDNMQEHTRPLILLKLYEELAELQTADKWTSEMEEASDVIFMTLAYMFEISNNAEIIDWLERKLNVIEERVGIKA